MKTKAEGRRQKAEGRRRCALRAFVLLVVVAWCMVRGVSAKEAEISAPAAAALTQQVKFDQNLGASVPLDAVFRDEAGKPVALRSLLGQRPVVLVMGYHECPMLCSLVLGGVVEAFTEMKATTGKDFDFIDVSINPADAPEAAAKQKRIYFKRYLRAGAEGGWHFLTSPKEATGKSLTDAVGFHYALDPATKQYAHPSGLVVLTPEGKVSGYLFGVTFDAGQLQSAVKTAGQRHVGSPIAQVLLLCFHYNPVTGKYGALILNILRVGGVLTVLAMAGGIAWLVRRPVDVPAT